MYYMLWVCRPCSLAEIPHAITRRRWLLKGVQHCRSAVTGLCMCRFFKTYFLDACLELTSDSVANVRLHLASLLPALKQSIR